MVVGLGVVDEAGARYNVAACILAAWWGVSVVRRQGRLRGVGVGLPTPCPRECLRIRDKAYILQQGYGATPLPSEAPCTDGCIRGALLLGRQPWRCVSCLRGGSEG
ncbi:hypothetical protein GOP47_0027235, partial [Adiantum capillus-veneris]